MYVCVNVIKYMYYIIKRLLLIFLLFLRFFCFWGPFKIIYRATRQPPRIDHQTRVLTHYFIYFTKLQAKLFLNPK